MSVDAAKMPIVLVVSGTTTAASAVYGRIDAACREHFPGHPLHWAYSSRVIRKRLRENTGEVLPTPGAVLEQLHREGHPRAVVQSLHLICGIEFHHMVWQAAQSPLDIHLGMPLLATPPDFETLLDWIATVQPTAPGEALVLVGHGTAHPAWMAYTVLAQGMARRFGETVLLGQVKGEPSPPVLADRLAAAGCRRVRLRPLMLVAGAHFMEDIAGAKASSWQSQLAGRGLEVSTAAEGLGADPVVIGIFRRHIETALASRPLDLS